MSFECLIISDSGSIEYTHRFLDNTEPDTYSFLKSVRNDFETTPPTLEFNMYDDNEFNSLNDILYAPDDLIVNDRTKDILAIHNIPDYRLAAAKVRRVDNKLGFIKRKKSYDYHWLYFGDNTWTDLYQQIDYEKSEIKVFDNNENVVDMSIKNIDDIYDIIDKNNQGEDRLDWRANKIVFTKSFDKTIDLFKLPLFSWMTYVSFRLKKALQEKNVKDIKFVKTGVKSRIQDAQNPLIELL